MGKYVKGDCEKLHDFMSVLTRPGRPVQIMEVCGTHTVAVARSGLRSLFPPGLALISGPGCPVCVTDQSYMDQAVELARRPGVIVATYGDMVRVPGRNGSLGDARRDGATVEVVASADQAVELAIRRSESEVVFLGVGFETTTPATAMAVTRACDGDIGNFSVLVAHKLILPAMRTLLSADDVPIDGFLCPGHVSVILGYRAFEGIVRDFARPCVVAGFDPSQILAGIVEILSELAARQPKACTVYPAVSAEGNVVARQIVDKVFVEADAVWRSLGTIPASGLALREEYAAFDAARRFELPETESYELPGCRCGEVITGRCRPADCGLFATRCVPRDPVGPCMVSGEGACAAAYNYERPAKDDAK
jgi:hydrogenase expression/formation protein HypD